MSGRSNKPPATRTASGFFDRWLFYDNNGSWEGWFDFLPLYMRVGPWHPLAVLVCVGFYASIFCFKPSTLYFPIAKGGADESSFWLAADVAVASYCFFVMAFCWKRYSGIMPYLFSYTGWSWSLLGMRALCSAAGEVALSHASADGWLHAGGAVLARIGSALRFPAIVGAVVTFTIWNLILFPMLLVVMPGADGPPRTPRRKAFMTREQFVRFNFSFFLTSLHVLNLPLAAVNIVVGCGARPLRDSDLWMGFAVIGAYALVYLFFLDRCGVHFYPIFNPRTGFSSLSYAALFAIYFYVHKGANLLVAEGLLCEEARTPPPPPVWWLYASWGGSMVLAGTVAACFPGLLGRAR